MRPKSRAEGGAVSLHRLSETVERIESHAEQAAAELAIARYEKEIAELEAQIKATDETNHTRTGFGCASAIALAVIALSLALSESNLAAAIVLGFAAIGIAVLVYRSASSTEATSLKAQLQGRRLKLARKRRIADGEPSPLS